MKQRDAVCARGSVLKLNTVRDVHKAPALDLVAVFTLGPPTGPLAEHVPLVQQLQHLYNDSLILLLFHPETVLDGSLRGGKLPITLYESYYEPGSEGADKGLQVDGWGLGTQLQLRFRKLDYEVETGEAEMIGIDFVAKGGGNAAAIAPLEAQAKPSSSKKGKAKVEEDTTTNGAASENYLSAEDDERTFLRPPFRPYHPPTTHPTPQQKLTRPQSSPR